jgi:peptidoglycan pentaglycine glycine transferase (the first glycine)
MKKFIGEPSQWNALLAGLPDTHLLQTWEWGAFKARFGWQPDYFFWDTASGDNQDNLKVMAAAVILKRIIPIKGFLARLCVLYIPKGPVFNWNDQGLRQRVLDDLQQYAKDQHAVFLKIDPDVIIGTGIPSMNPHNDHKPGREIIMELETRNWFFSNEQIQFRNTVRIDLTLPEDEIKSSFKQKTRYNINLAVKKGVIVRKGTLDDLAMLYRMYAETSIRDGFIIREEAYYRTVWESFMSTHISRNFPFAVPLIAEFSGEPIAAVFIFGFSSRAYYLYGMSRENHREKMPNYLLQWEAIKLARDYGCLEYDLWGAPDEFNEMDPLWGVYRFKEGLGGMVVRTLGAWDFPVNPFLYKIYTKTLPGILNIMRMRGRTQIKKAAAI